MSLLILVQYTSDMGNIKYRQHGFFQHGVLKCFWVFTSQQRYRQSERESVWSLVRTCLGLKKNKERERERERERKYKNSFHSTLILIRIWLEVIIQRPTHHKIFKPSGAKIFLFENYFYEKCSRHRWNFCPRRITTEKGLVGCIIEGVQLSFRNDCSCLVELLTKIQNLDTWWDAEIELG